MLVERMARLFGGAVTMHLHIKPSVRKKLWASAVNCWSCSFQTVIRLSHNVYEESGELPETVHFLKNREDLLGLMIQALKSVLLWGGCFLPAFSSCGLDLQTGSIQHSFLTDLLLRPRAMFSSLSNLTTASFLKSVCPSEKVLLLVP